MKVEPEVHSLNHYMKMKINDVLEAINSTLETERTKRSLNVKGHFVAVIEIQKALGQYKKYHVSIIYIDISNKENIDFISKYYTHKTPKEKEDKVKTTVECEVLIPFFSKVIENWENIVKGVWK